MQHMDILALGYTAVVTMAVAMARTLGMIMLTPAFTRLGLTGLIRNAVAFALSLPLVPGMFSMVAAAELPSGFILIALIIKEMLIGAIIGLVFGIPFWGAEMAGEMIDLQRGSTMSQLVDPLSSGETSVTATLFSLMMVVLFFMSGSFLFLIDGLYQSYTLWPVGAMMPVVSANAGMAILALLDHIVSIAVMMIAPIVIAIMVTDVMLALLSRMAPQLHIFDLSMSVKNLLFTFLLVIYMVFLTPLMFEQLSALKGQMAKLAEIAF